MNGELALNVGGGSWLQERPGFSFFFFLNESSERLKCTLALSLALSLHFSGQPSVNQVELKC